MYTPDTTKYLIHLFLQAEGVVEKSDVVGAIFGQTEGLLGDDLDLRDLQRTGRMGRIDVQITSRKGETRGDVLIATSLDKAETALLAAALETIDRVGPCSARITVDRIEDIRVSRRRKIVDRAKELILEEFDEGAINSDEIMDVVREFSRIEKIGTLGETQLPAGPNVTDSDAIIVVEGRADVINLLRYGIKNAVAVEGTKIPEEIIQLTRSKTSTVFLDGDRGGDLILSELLQVADIDYIAFAPRGKSVEELSRKEVLKGLRNKVPVEFVTEHQAGEPLKKPVRRLSPPQPVPVGEDIAPGEGKEELAKLTLKDHIGGVKGRQIARFLSSEFQVVEETGAGSLEQVLEGLNGEVRGVVVDRVVDQHILDLCVGKGLEYVAAPGFSGIVKKPVSVRLIKMA
ncbi:MAG: DNA primase DnaG [Methanomicrobiaceae archaeon]|nr:DNA primase DnaG [Methanomicrobiaceae archaeon]